MRKIYVSLLSLFLFFIINTKLNAQAVGTYVFVPSAGTYTPLAGFTTTTATGDDGTQGGIALGFNFTYGGAVYTHAAVTTNGFLRLGNSAAIAINTGTANYDNSNFGTSTNNPLIAGIWDDNNATGGSIVFLSEGSAPNRTFSVEWKNIHMGDGGSAATPTATFKITLKETSNAVVIEYGTVAFSNSTASIGLNDATSFLSVTPGAPATASAAVLNNSINSATNLTSGTTYTFLPPPPCVAPPGGGTVSGPAGTVCPGASFTLSVTGASFGTGLTYEWQSSSDNATWNPAGGTGAAFTTSILANTYFRRKITCSGSDAFSASVLVSTSPAVSVFPWTENFDALATVGATSFPTCWVKQNGDWRSANNGSTGNDANARSAPNFIQNPWSATNEFIWTVGFQLTAGTSYDFSFWYADFTPGFNSWAGEVWVNGVPNSAGATQVGAAFATIGVTNPTTYTQVKRVFIPATSGVYFFAIRLNEATANPWYLNFDDFSFDVTPPCVPPSAVSLSAVTTTTATATWTASVSTPAGGYQWEVRTSGAPGSGAAGLAASGSTLAGVTTANIGGLTPNTAYTLHVRAVCAAGVTFSPWETPYNFRTSCLAVNSFPYTETFEAASLTRYCWVPTQVSGAVNWTIGAGAGNGGSITTAHGGAENARHFGGGTGSVARLVSPSLNFSSLSPTLGAQVAFWYANESWAGDQNELRVFYKTSAAGAWTLIPGAVYTSNIGAWTEVELTLPSSGGATDYYIAFEGTELFGWGVAVDDITISQAPSCPKPTNVVALGVTPTTAIVSFSSPGNAFIVEYGPPGFVPGTTNVAGAGQLAFGAASPITIGSLTPNTLYDFYVRRICIPGVDFSVNVKATASTLCNPTAVPYAQNFETATTPGFPTCTSMEDVNGNSGPVPNGGGGRWITNSVAQTYVSPTKSLWYIYDFPNTARGGDDWFYLQGLNLTAGTSYRVKAYYKSSDAPNWFEKFEIKYGTMAHSSAMTNLIYSNPGTTTNAASPFDSLIVDFIPAATGVYYIGFHNISDPDQAFLFIDDISVKVSPKVDVGITGLILPSLNCPTSGVFVKAKIRNYNTVPQNFATYPVTVTATITGAAAGILTTTLGADDGILAPGAEREVYLAPSFNFTTAGVYNITTTTISPDDPETGNDANVISINVNPNPVAPIITPSSAAICIGGGVQLNTQFTNPPPAAVTLPAATSGAITVNVPDASAVGATHSIPVTGVPVGATVTGVSVVVNMTHTWDPDMIINLKGPNGKVLNLFNRRGLADDDNITAMVISSASSTSLATGTAPFTGTFAADAAMGVGPTGSVSDVNTFQAVSTVGNGSWTLAMQDLGLGDFGILTSWSITITYQMLNPVVTWTPVTGLFTSSAATTPYTAGTDAYSVYAKPAATTAYTATATSSAGCTVSTTVNVTVNPIPPVTVGSIPDTVCISDQAIQLSATPVGGSWSGVGTSGNTFVPSSTAIGTYTLTYSYISSLGCTGTATKRIAVKDCPERVIRLSDNAITLFPNPNLGLFNIRINSVLYSYLGMKVYSNNGTLVRTQQFGGLTYGRVIPIDMTNLPGGVYTVHFYYDDGVRSSEKAFKVIIGLP